MTFWSPPALTLDMTAFKAIPGNEANGVHDVYFIYQLSYCSGNYAAGSHNLIDRQEFVAAFGTQDSSQLMDNTLVHFPQDLKNRLQ
ncbi:hypothetical protein SBOR_1096 [Sclerotinia borealis F-4128]|uniref:Uncharacterized protein n=1 Tax=Sclerotinia borealis (strain F-4128) TaxID=1432307 RepID=W9CV13_SCLBF|nr:hypothetical protein SBOR_1096 [Sclerotinia borealis F-4128]